MGNIEELVISINSQMQNQRAKTGLYLNNVILIFFKRQKFVHIYILAYKQMRWFDFGKIIHFSGFHQIK